MGALHVNATALYSAQRQGTSQSDRHPAVVTMELCVDESVESASKLAGNQKWEPAGSWDSGKRSLLTRVGSPRRTALPACRNEEAWRSDSFGDALSTRGVRPSTIHLYDSYFMYFYSYSHLNFGCVT